MARGSQDLVKKNSKLDSFLQRSLTAETYDRIRGYESCICVSDKENKAFKFVILSDEWIYLTENPPKSIQGVVHFRDVVSVELINDFPEFLSGEEQTNTQHIAVKFVTTEPHRRRTLRRARKSPSSSITDLNNGADRSSSLTPLGYASSLDGSEDLGYFTQSMVSLPGSRPTSRGSTGSPHDGRGGVGKKKKKALPLGDGRDHDNNLLSLKEELDEDILEDMEEEQQTSAVRRVRQAPLGGAAGCERTEGLRNFKDGGGSDTARSLPPPPKTAAFEKVMTLRNDGPEEAVTPSSTKPARKWHCPCPPFGFCRVNRSEVAPSGHEGNARTQGVEFSSKSQLMAADPHSGGKVPSLAIISTHDDAGITLPNAPSRSSSVLGSLSGIHPPSRTGTPSLEADKYGSLPSELYGSVNGLNMLPVDSNPEQRQTVLHIYMLSSSSPMIMLLRGAWHNYLIRATLELESTKEADGLSHHPILNSKSSYREKNEMIFSTVKRQLSEPGNSMESYFQLFTDLKQATETNFLLKRLFWRSEEIFALMVQQLQQYMPNSKANLQTEDGRGQRIDELDFSILIISTLSLMFRESEIVPVRLQTLKGERCRHVVDLLVTLTSPPMEHEKKFQLIKHWSAPPKPAHLGLREGSTKDNELSQLYAEYIRVSITAVFELFLVAKQSQTEVGHGFLLSLGWMVRVIDEAKNMEQFVERVMGQVLAIINLARHGSVSGEQAVQLYQQFTILMSILEYSPQILTFLHSHYHEEFKYFIKGPVLARKIPTSYPIAAATVHVVGQVSSKVLSDASSRASKTQW